MLGKMMIHGLVAAILIGGAAAVYAQARADGTGRPGDNGYLQPGDRRRPHRQGRPQACRQARAACRRPQEARTSSTTTTTERRAGHGRVHFRQGPACAAEGMACLAGRFLPGRLRDGRREHLRDAPVRGLRRAGGDRGTPRRRTARSRGQSAPPSSRRPQGDAGLAVVAQGPASAVRLVRRRAPGSSSVSPPCPAPWPTAPPGWSTRTKPSPRPRCG